MNLFLQSLGVSEALNGDPNGDYVNRPNARNYCELRGLDLHVKRYPNCCPHGSTTRFKMNGDLQERIAFVLRRFPGPQL